MPPETALIESRALRDSVVGRTEVLDKVKALAVLPDGVHVTTQGVADYFEVGERVVNKLIQRHRDELANNGFVVLRGADLERFKGDNLSLYQGGVSESYPQARSNLALFTRRTVLNVAMLLRDSDIARQVRTYLLDAEEAAVRLPQSSAGYVSLEQLVTDTAAKAAERILEGPIGARLDSLGSRLDSLDARVTNVESCLPDVGSALRELGPVIAGISMRVERIDRRLDATHQVVGAMSERLAVFGEDLRAHISSHTHS
ncbi:hypothetical protein [Actinacidiphila soli]|uniref:hypothetical protein n=1 Tax=Actinacidiphila soli TaxID=2487275 RepID=UPI000FCCABA0|nr:hypothetical protein [Actinacidiphila soli]